MANAGLGFRNRFISGVTLSGGSWLAALPLANALTTDRAEVARSTNALAASTQFDVDFGVAVAIRAVHLAAHNCSQTATWRVTLGTAAGLSDIADSTGQAVWYLPFMAPAPEEWETNNWWGLQQDEYMGHPFGATILFSSSFNARYMHIAITDTTNAAGYVQLGRVWAGDVFIPVVNHDFGSRHGHKDKSQRVETLGGGFQSEKLRRQRTSQIMLSGLTDNEGAWVHEINRRAGTVEEILYLPDVADYTACQRYGFIGVLDTLSPLSQDKPSRNSVGFQLTEWL